MVLEDYLGNLGVYRVAQRTIFGDNLIFEKKGLLGFLDKINWELDFARFRTILINRAGLFSLKLIWKPHVPRKTIFFFIVYLEGNGFSSFAGYQ